MIIRDNRVARIEKFELGDVIRGQSGTYYMIIKSGHQYKLLDLADGVTRFEAQTIASLIAQPDRDDNKTHIKNIQVEVTFK